MNEILLTSSKGYHLAEVIRHRHKYRHKIASTGGWVWCTEVVMPLVSAPQSLRNNETKMKVSQMPCQCPKREPSFSSDPNQETTLMIQGCGVETSHLCRKAKYRKEKVG